MVRPKSTKPIKSKKISARLTEADYMKIKAVYGSIQAFLDLMVKTLPILVLVSCKGVEVPADSAKASTAKEETVIPTEPEEVYEIDTNIYSTINYYTATPQRLAYSLSVKCTDTKCYVSGMLYEFIRTRGLNTDGIKDVAVLDRHGEFSYGEICMINGGCYSATLKGTSHLAIENTTKCMSASTNASFNVFEAFRIASTHTGSRFNFNYGSEVGQCSAFN